MEFASEVLGHRSKLYQAYSTPQSVSTDEYEVLLK